jgi:signal transduction histidine kinase
VLLTVLAGLVAVGALLGLFVLRLVEATRRLALRERQAAAALAEVSQAKTDFIADVSHQLRTPLTVMRGNAEVGLAMHDDPEHGEILREIADEAARMAKMVEDLLFLARSDSTGVPVELAEHSVAAWTAEVGGRAATLARDLGADLEVDLHGNGRARLDGERLSQAVLVLVDNAAKHARGSPITLSGGSQNDALVISVADRGAGIPAEELPHVFERYHRGPRSSDNPGTGLGLAIARTIVEGHGGTITAEARAGGGTVVTITIPLVQARDASEEGAWRARPGTDPR